MPYANANRNYNTRNSGRFNTPGHFIPPTEQQKPQQSHTQGYLQMYPNQNQASNNYNQAPPNEFIQTTDENMKTEIVDNAAPELDKDGNPKPHWMKNKLSGVKKISNKERRRRQNENLRRLLTPKNALMVLNEMMPGEAVANQFKVEAAPPKYYQAGPNFCADLSLDGNTYKGFGENKMVARNAAAEQAVRDIIIRRMAKQLGAGGAEGVCASLAGAADMGEGDDETLPMIQLASFALHKLFSEWECEGHRVPQLKPPPAHLMEYEGNSEGAGDATPKRSKAKPPKTAADLPLNAAAMHPCMLLTFMRPGLEYREVGVEGATPQTTIYTISVDADGATYTGKGPNKKEARKAAAKRACEVLFSVNFDENPTGNAPVVRPQE